MASICVFCGSRSGSDAIHVGAATALGRILALRGDTLIYGGGSTGLMGAIADEMLRHGADVVGVIPEALANVELMHTGVSDMRVVPNMHVRKATMHELADAYIALPGGFGTMEELFEVLCWAQLKFHAAPIAVLNPDGYYDGLITLINSMISEQFLDPVYRRLLTAASSADELEAWLHAQFAPSEEIS